MKRRLHVDVIAAVPFGAMFGYANPLTLLRLGKLIRVRDIMYRWRTSTVQYVTVLRLVFLGYWLALAAHWIACGWLAIRPVAGGVAFDEHYVRALYWAVTTLSTVGYGDVSARTPPEMMYSMFVMVLGVVVYGYVIGSITNLINSFDLTRKHYMEQSEQLRAFMQYRRIPPPMQRRISEYYDYSWGRQLGYDEQAILSNLPPGLRSELTLYLKREIIEKVPIFRDIGADENGSSSGDGEDFIRDIAQEIRPALYTPGDFIVRKGEPARGMYFISRGSVEVVDTQGLTIATLSEGDFFGEIALILDRVRSASIRAVEYCDVHVLDKAAFHAVLAKHPEFADRVMNKALEREAQNKAQRSSE
jgi:voltage-gated potassium channel